MGFIGDRNEAIFPKATAELYIHFKKTSDTERDSDEAQTNECFTVLGEKGKTLSSFGWKSSVCEGSFVFLKASLHIDFM